MVWIAFQCWCHPPVVIIGSRFIVGYYSWTPLFRSPKGNEKKFEIAGLRNNRGSVKGKGKSKGIRSSFEIARFDCNLLIFELTVINNDKGRNSIVPLVQSMPPVDWTSLQTVPRGVTLNDDHSVKTKRTWQYPARIWMYIQSNLKQSQNQAEKLIRNFQTSNAKLASSPVKWTHS